MPGAGRKTPSPFPAALKEIVATSVSSAGFANYAEISNGLSYLSGAGWTVYNVAELPGPFRGALFVWIDLSWTDAPPGTVIPLEVVVELITPAKTATFSEKATVSVTLSEASGFDRVTVIFSLFGTFLARYANATVVAIDASGTVRADSHRHAADHPSAHPRHRPAVTSDIGVPRAAAT
jgi:hypothetical protein